MPGGKMGQGWKFSFNGGLVQSQSDYPTPKYKKKHLITALILVQYSNGWLLTWLILQFS